MKLLFLPPAARGRFLKKLPPGPLQKLLFNFKKHSISKPFGSIFRFINIQE
jgi:hypothetical protein